MAHPQTAQPAVPLPALSERERRFVDAYMGAAAGNGREAARLAGYKGNENVLRVQASRLLAKANVQAAIATLQAERERSTEVTVARVLKELARIGLCDPRHIFTPTGALLPPTEWSDDLARAIASVEVVRRRTGNPDEPYEDIHKIRFWDKNAALDKIARYLGMFIERHEHTGKNGGPIVIEDVRDQLVARAVALAESDTADHVH